MKPNVLVTLYNAKVKHIQPLTEDVIVATIVDLIKPVQYIPYDSKLKLVEETINASRNAAHPTAIRYRNFIINMISVYTNIEMDEKGFDLLSENKMIDIIISTFKSEYIICNNLMQMCVDDDMMMRQLK